VSPTLLRVLPPVLCLAFAVAAVLALRQSRTASARTRRAVAAQGVVTAVEYNVSQQVLPVVAFTTTDGRAVQAQPSSTSNTRRFSVGQQVGLRYDPADPAWIAVDGLPGASGVDAVAGVVLGLGAVVLAVVTVLTR
jgi:hypothetical protein